MRISVDGSRIRNNKVAFSNLSGIVWTGPLTQLKNQLRYISMFQALCENCQTGLL